MLGDYLHFCPTRVMASQAIDVALETLLQVKYMVFNMVPDMLTEELRVQHFRLVLTTPCHSMPRLP